MGKKDKTNDKAEKRKERNALRNQMKETLRNFLATEPQVDETVINAIKFLAGKSKQGRVAKTPGYMLVIEYITEKQKVSEDEIWNQFKMGRVEMRSAIRKYVKKTGEGNEMAWITLNDDNDYEVVAVSDKVPENWEDPLPVAVEVVNDEVEVDDDSVEL